MEVLEVYEVTIEEYSKLHRRWKPKKVYYSTEAAAKAYFETVTTDKYRRKDLKQLYLLKSGQGYFPLPNPVPIIR